MTKDVKHLKCFWAIWDYSVENSLLISAPHFLLGLFGLLIPSFLSSLYILDIRPLSDVGLVKILSHSIHCHFVLLTVSFALQKLQFHEVPFINCLLYIVLLVFCSGSCRLCHAFENYFPLFYQVQCTCFILRSLIHLDLSFVQGDKYGSVCILLHADIQLKMLYFSIV